MGADSKVLCDALDLRDSLQDDSDLLSTGGKLTRAVRRHQVLSNNQ